MTQAKTISQAPAGRKTDYRQLGKTMGRVLGYMLRNYKFSFFLVVLCIIAPPWLRFRARFSCRA